MLVVIIVPQGYLNFSPVVTVPLHSIESLFNVFFSRKALAWFAVNVGRISILSWSANNQESPNKKTGKHFPVNPFDTKEVYKRFVALLFVSPTFCQGWTNEAYKFRTFINLKLKGLFGRIPRYSICKQRISHFHLSNRTCAYTSPVFTINSTFNTDPQTQNRYHSFPLLCSKIFEKALLWNF